ncbi:MAG: tannase/feruloyl esterase family alpha/beta hydrolase [Verrucomicrobia bacterium]|nr:tannase/feruloyl esterase family alpha/beta hydrolase [Verrucomicrobiota bacterium]
MKIRLVSVFVLLAGLVFAQRPAPLYPDATPVIAPDDLRKVTLPNTTIETVSVEEKEGFVRVTASVTHPPASDRVKVWVALPLKNWNGRFMGMGGGGFVTGRPEGLRGPAAQGFAAASTDGGHDGGSGNFALNASGRLNWQEIRDFAYLGIHEMTVVGKALTKAFYGQPARYAYFIGSSTGGRQGLMAAQRFPDDYDGIFSGCPAINWAKMVPATLWPQVVMAEAKHLVSKAKLEAVTAAAIAACDAADGVTDGVIDDPLRCTWDPKAFVGTMVGDSAFSEADAGVVREIWAGPRGHRGRFLWHGLTRGSNLVATGGSDGTPLVAKPFGIAVDWYRYFLVLSPGFDGTSVTRGEFELCFNQSVEQFAPVFSADNPDLTRFRDRGGKVIITHGLADQLIPPQGSIEYYEKVQKRMGGADKAAEFARLFLVPGVDHGFRGAGPTPQGTQAALIRWVEEGKAPDRLPGEVKDKDGKVLRTRPLFPYPQFAKYSGTGSTDDAANFVAATPVK